MNCRFIPLLVTATLIIINQCIEVLPSYSKDLGQVGKTYPIDEQDVSEALKLEAMKLDEQRKKESLLHKVRTYQPPDLKTLPHATQNRSFLVDMTYTLDHDIVDRNGSVIYPKGYSFNPLDYVSLPGGIVVIDGTSKEHIDWFLNSPYADNPHVRVFLSNGYAFSLMEQLERPIFFLSNDIAERLNISVLPSVIAQHNKKLQIFEINTVSGTQGVSQ